MSAPLNKVYLDDLLKYSVVFTVRSLNHMTVKF